MIRFIRLFPLLVLLLLQIGVQAQGCQPNPPARILLVGDSWSAILWENKTLRNTLNFRGYGDWTEEGDFTTIAGATAAMWADPSFLNIISGRLLDNTALEVVVLLIGGNDVLAGKLSGGWFVGMGAAEETALYNRIENNIRTIITHIRNTRPGTKVLICGYDYVNLYNTLNEPANLLTWDNLGQPTPRQVNDAIIALEQRKINIANADPDVYYVQNLGRMQNKYGYPGFFGAGVAPLPGNTAPNYTPFPGGLRDFPTPTAALANNGTDPIHLNEAGYSLIANALFDHFFSPVIFKPGVNASYKSSGLLNDGFVKPNNTKSNAQLRMGRDGGGTYRNILSFATAALPDNAQITGASILLTRSGTSLVPLPRPIDELDCQLDIRKGNFGNQAALETLDYTAAASASDIGCFVSSAQSNSGKLRIDVDPSALLHINTTGNTQFRFFVASALSGTTYTAFYDGDAGTANKPLLELRYSLPGLQPGTEQVSRFASAPPAANGDPDIYPNPARRGGILQVWAPSGGPFRFSDILGRLVLSGTFTEGDNSILLPSDIPAGMYFLRFGPDDQVSSHSVILAD